MRSLVVRVTLTLLAIGAIAAAAYVAWAAETRAAASRHAASRFEDTRMAALRDAFDLRAAQQAYVAAGQSETFWFGKVTAAVEGLRATLTTMGVQDTAIEAALAALQDFEQVDGRARAYVTSGQSLLASDTIFSDGLDTTGRIIAALEQAGHGSRQEAALAASAARREQLLAIGGAGLIALLVLLLLVPVPAAPAATATSVASVAPVADSPRMEVPSHNEGLDVAMIMRDEPAPVVVQAAPQSAPAQAPVDMQALAAICTDLARLSDTGGLPRVLEHAATVLDASGLVLWVVDPDGKELMPVATHGYPTSVLARLGTLKVDAENATASAFRTGLVQTVKADTMSHGAIAAPLATPNGCRGVMSAEVRNDGETEPAKLAAASIMAAQLASLIGPPAARTENRTSAAL